MQLDLLAPPPLQPAYPDAATLLRPQEHIDALYIHVPFCASKCHYCDFYSLAGHLDRAEPFLDALATEIDLHRRARNHRPLRPSTIFIGGGTPTLLSPPHLQRLLRLITAAIDPSALIEFTVEANPNTFDPDRAAILAAAGVNRLSFGAQSFIPEELRTLQRDHDPESVPAAFQLARAAGIQNLNLDLIFGIPGQSLASLNFSLARALELLPQHLSVYSLIYEPNTPMAARLHRGEFAPIDEDLELAMFDLVHSRLKNAGFQRYEISNHALPGRECRHNIHYWKAANWLAWGPSAAGHYASQPAPHTPPRNWRWKNVGSLAHYLDALAAPSPKLPWTNLEARDPHAFIAETVTFWLRLNAGLDYAQCAARLGLTPDALRLPLERLLQKYADLHLLELTPTHARITDKGLLISNRIFADTLSLTLPDPPLTTTAHT